MAEVIQADRDRASDCMARTYDPVSGGPRRLEALHLQYGDDDGHYLIQAFASHRQAAELRAAKAAIEAAVQACKEQSKAFASEEYATPQPIGSISERFACQECEKAIAALDPEAILKGERKPE